MYVDNVVINEIKNVIINTFLSENFCQMNWKYGEGAATNWKL